jgi:hypothetical protein
MMSHRESHVWKRPHLSPKVLKGAIAVWDQGEAYTPSTETVFDELNEER